MRRQLVVGDQLVDGGNVEVHLIDFDANSIQPVRKTTWATPDIGNDMTLKLKAGRFNWGSPTEQIAWMSSTAAGGTRLSVLTVDPLTLNVSRKADILPINDPGSRYGGYDIAVGNFDHMQKSTADPTQLERDPDLQIAVFGARLNTSNGQTGTAALYIYDVSDDYSTLTQASSISSRQITLAVRISRACRLRRETCRAARSVWARALRSPLTALNLPSCWQCHRCTLTTSARAGTPLRRSSI